ncbi:VOC family protein [Stenotrophomonas sp. SY1]|uniref:VOC family protein n=1 Tax=Stenotrophomonas sp. SY1 TaxID=477235 RepID=UPI001E63C6E0|nr:VOC family protein [Stenotrophomonas sp. SY1]MCD9088608.1 VOC family protein [Stenotrophomonas sp. SY1]
MKLQFERFTLFCRDMDASLRFYRDTLGMVVVEEKTLRGAMAGGLLQLPPCTMRIALLAASDDAPVIVGLFEISDVTIDAIEAPQGKPAHGQTALVLSTTAFDALQQAITAAGYRFLTPPLTYPKRVASERSPAGMYRELIAYDPDNVPVSILQIDPLPEEAAA